MLIQKIDDWGGQVIEGEPVSGDLVRITRTNSVEEKIYYVPPPVVEPNRIYLHADVTGGDGETPPGIENDGIDSLSFSLVFRETAEPTSAILTAITNVGKKIPFRDDTGIEYDLVALRFVNGECHINYTSDSRAATVTLLASDVAYTYAGNLITLVSEPTFQVYRDFTPA